MKALSCLVIGLLCTAAVADDVQQGWVADMRDPKTLMASTSNEAGFVLALLCYPQSGECGYALELGVTCNQGKRYPALVNTDSGSRSITLACGRKVRSENFLVVAEFDQLNELVLSGERIGFAMPLESDNFKVIRFSLAGASTAITQIRGMLEILREPGKAPPRAATEQL